MKTNLSHTGLLHIQQYNCTRIILVYPCNHHRFGMAGSHIHPPLSTHRRYGQISNKYPCLSFPINFTLSSTQLFYKCLCQDLYVCTIRVLWNKHAKQHTLSAVVTFPSVVADTTVVRYHIYTRSVVPTWTPLTLIDFLNEKSNNHKKD